MSHISTTNIEREKSAILAEFARESASAILLRGKSWPPKARYDGTKRNKFQTSLTDEEAAEIEAIRAVICPQMTRYAFMRYLIREFCDVARTKVDAFERNCCWL